MNDDFNLFPLTTGIMTYQETGKDGDRLIAQCALFMYQKLKKHPYLDEDMKQEFLLQFLPYLKKLINGFCLQAVPFEAFLSYVVKRRVKTFLRIQRRRSLLWSITRDASIGPAYQPEEPSPSTPLRELARMLGIGKDGAIEHLVSRRRFLIWVLRESRGLSPDDYPLIARLSCVPEEWIAEKTRLIKESLQKRETRLEHLRERRNQLFVSARVLEMQIRREFDLNAKRVLVLQLRKKRCALVNLMRRIGRIPLHPTHRTIAAGIGVPKGSVDSGLARLKQIIEAAGRAPGRLSA